jgi:fermentation-respiration switch protein FrsA (DUF1100 family)
MPRALILIFAGIILIVSYIKYIENRGIFYPQKEIDFTPALINLNFDDIYFDTADGVRLNAWFIPGPSAKYTILFLHGNAGNIGSRIEKIQMFNAKGLNTFIIDYRGYGHSKGRPSEKGLYLDGLAAFDYLVNIRKLPEQNIILYGESVGGSIAIEVAAKRNARALITEEAFSSAKDMAKVIYPFLPRFLFADKYNSLKKVRFIKIPKLFIHSVSDEIVPFKLAEKLFNAAAEPKELIEIEGSHNRAFIDSQKKYLAAISLFISKLDR